MEQNACFDSPSSLDFVYEQVFGTQKETPEAVEYIPKTIFNQGAEHITRMACTRYGLIHVVNAQNQAVDKITGTNTPELNPKAYWLDYLSNAPLAEEQGATLQSALSQITREGLITGYSVCNDTESMKDSIAKGRLIYTGSNNGDWSLTDQVYKLRTDGRVVGHAYCIVGYNNEGWIAINSYGQSNGKFIIPYDLTSSLYNRYSIMDTKDEEAIISYKKRIMQNITIEDAKKALESKVWNGERAQEPATREEVAAMIHRAIESGNV